MREDFADPDNGDAAALFEAFIDAAVDSAEDRKCVVLANLYASLAFDGSASIDDALLYVKRVRDASWRQLVALQYLADESRTNERELAGVKGEEGDAKAAAAMAAEMEELAETLGLVGVGQEGGAVVNWDHGRRSVLHGLSIALEANCNRPRNRKPWSPFGGCCR